MEAEELLPMPDFPLIYHSPETTQRVVVVGGGSVNIGTRAALMHLQLLQAGFVAAHLPTTHGVGLALETADWKPELVDRANWLDELDTILVASPEPPKGTAFFSEPLKFSIRPSVVDLEPYPESYLLPYPKSKYIPERNDNFPRKGKVGWGRSDKQYTKDRKKNKAGKKARKKNRR